MKKRTRSLILLLVISIGIVCLSLLLGSNVESYRHFRHAQFGLPIPFLIQDLYVSGAENYEGEFPHRFSLQMDFLDNNPQFEFNLFNFLSSVFIVFVLLYIFYSVLSKMKNRL